MKYVKVLLWMAVLLGLLVPDLSVAQTAKFRIGCALPLTGVFGKEGNLVKDAYTFWAEAVNARGGITVAGKKYAAEMVFFDDKSDKAESAKLVERMATLEKLDLILGGFGTDSVFAASAISEKYKYPMISGGASSNKLFERGFKYYFSTLGKATEEVRGCVEITNSLNPKPKTAAIIGSDILFTALAAEGYRTYLKKLNIEEVYFELFPLSLEDYNSLLFKIKQKNPDVLLVGSHLKVALSVMKALKEVDFMPKMVAFSYGPTVPDFIKSLGKDAEYVVAAAEWAPNLPYKDSVFGTARELNDNYFKKFGRYPDYVEVASIGGALVQQWSIEKLGIAPPLKEAGRVKLMEELHQGDWMTVYGRIQFGADGANVDHPPVAVQVQDGKLVTVFPKEVVEKPVLYPAKAWRERK
ncbi:MAG: amino acid ABC transporter substrate-binding protein [Thermodesulfobacteriota bacterium]|jgi:branched-chain amino acid transport system substrate-binding protein